MLTGDALTPEVVRAVLGLDGSDEIAVTFLRSENHTWRLSRGNEVWYLKAHTKPWYGADPDSAAGTVRHEHTAHRILAEAGLPTPNVVAAVATADNPLGWPYLLTEAVPGTSLPEILRQTRPVEERDAALLRTGRHLASMHALRYEHAGYLTDGPPTADPDPARWQHPIWRFERFLQGAIQSWSADIGASSPETMDKIMILVSDTLERLRTSFDPPRFTHGDCHADGFFLQEQGSDWSVSGVLDLEVASAGNPMFDFNSIFIELAGRLRRDLYDWWTPLFAGYGTEPDFDLARLLLVAAPHTNYACFGDHSWAPDRPGIVEHIVNSTTWEQLFRPPGVVVLSDR